MTAQLGVTGNASSLHAVGPAGPPGGRGGPRDPRRRARRPAQRGGLHLRRHRGRQPRGQGPVLVPPRRRPAPDPRPGQPGRAPRRPRRRRLARPSTRARASSTCRSTGTAGSHPRRAARGASTATPTTWRWSPSCGRTTRSAPCSRSRELAEVGRRVRRPAARRRRAGLRPAAGRLRRVRARRDDRHRAQDRRPARHRRAAARPRASTPYPCCTAAARSATCAPAPWTCPPIAAFAVAGRLAAERRGEVAARARRAARRADRGRAARPCRTRSSAATRADRLPANAHFSFPGCEGDSLLLLLDAQGIECSTGSACTAGVAQPSHVLLAHGRRPGAGARHAAVLPRPHLHRRRTSRRSPRPSARRSSAPAAGRRERPGASGPVRAQGRGARPRSGRA